MEKILIDSDVVIDFLRGYDKRIKKLFEKIERKEIIPYITLINIVELYCGADIEDKSRENTLLELLSHVNVINLSEEMAKQAGILKRKYGLGLADSIIAACCIEEDIKLVTFNQKHFHKIKELKFYQT